MVINSIRNLFPVLLLLVFIISFAYAVFRKKQNIPKNPVAMVGFMAIFLSILLLLTVFASKSEHQKDSALWVYIMSLQISIFFAYTAFKDQQKRIDALEEKLNNQTAQKE